MRSDWLRLIRGEFLVLDTETTGLDGNAEIVEISIIDQDGAILLDTFIKPSRPIPAQATAVHGITDQTVASAPTWGAIVGEYSKLVSGKPVLVYNASYDSRIIRQTSSLHNVPVAEPFLWVCIMEEFKSLYNLRKWYSLERAATALGVSAEGELHRALTDTKLALAVARKMAGL